MQRYRFCVRADLLSRGLLIMFLLCLYSAPHLAHGDAVYLDLNSRGQFDCLPFDKHFCSGDNFQPVVGGPCTVTRTKDGYDAVSCTISRNDNLRNINWILEMWIKNVQPRPILDFFVTTYVQPERQSTQITTLGPQGIITINPLSIDDSRKEVARGTWTLINKLGSTIGIDTRVTERPVPATPGSPVALHTTPSANRDLCVVLSFSPSNTSEDCTNLVTPASVANIAQQGSLLIFPDINVQPDRTTVIQLTNQAHNPVNMKCYYANQSATHNSFRLTLGTKQTVSWDAKDGIGDPTNVPAFPTTQTVAFGDPLVGELLCFAVDATGSQQVYFNHLSGVATVYNTTTSTAYTYNSWNFRARPAAGLTLEPGPGTPHGPAGALYLTGVDDGNSYDACPAYNIVHFVPGGATRSTALGEVSQLDTKIAISTCNQDFTNNAQSRWTDVQMPVWNTSGTKLAGAFECAYSTHHFFLSQLDGLAGNTSSQNLQTTAAHMQLQGVARERCTRFLPAGAQIEETGLVAVVSSYSRLPNGMTTATGVTSATAGVHAVPGLIQWAP